MAIILGITGGLMVGLVVGMALVSLAPGRSLKMLERLGLVKPGTIELRPPVDLDPRAGVSKDMEEKLQRAMGNQKSGRVVYRYLEGKGSALENPTAIVAVRLLMMFGAIFTIMGAILGVLISL